MGDGKDGTWIFENGSSSIHFEGVDRVIFESIHGSKVYLGSGDSRVYLCTIFPHSHSVFYEWEERFLLLFFLPLLMRKRGYMQAMYRWYPSYSIYFPVFVWLYGGYHCVGYDDVSLPPLICCSISML